jgi:hypothetical protein
MTCTFAVEQAMAKLCGKGLWLAHSYDLQRAAEMATSIDATYLLVKVGHGPYYFPETARSMVKRVRALGFHPLAWVQITDRVPQDALKAIVEAQTLGYEATILFLGAALVTGDQMRPLAEALDNVEIPRERLYLATPPSAHLPDPRVLDVLAPICQAGWMPLAFAAWGNDPQQVIHREIYQTLDALSLVWDKTPEVYPVLSPLYRLAGPVFLPEELIPWIEELAQHGLDFFSVYHVANTEKALWPLLQSINVRCQEELAQSAAPEPTVAGMPDIPQPVYFTVTTSDTVWGIITRHGLTKQQFWAWNAHLWESRGLPRDPDYLQEGWRIRVK